MARRRDRVPAVEIEVALAVRRLDPHALAALRRERHLLVRRELKLLFARRDLVEVWFCVSVFIPHAPRPGTLVSGTASTGMTPSA